jgi:hypothetical protein
MSPYTLFSIATVLVPLASYIYAGDWESLRNLVWEHRIELLCILEAIALFVSGILRRYRLGAMLCACIIITITWGAE